jgi:outer membrane protein assembly factor BamD
MQTNSKGVHLLLLLVILAAIALAGCRSFRSQIEVEVIPEEELYQIGIGKYNEENWYDAVAVFERFERLYPNSERIREIRLKRADAHFNKQRNSGYILAKGEYQSFIALYPRYEEADYVWKQIAVCSFKQILPPNRDQSHTHQAIEDFQTFLQRFPDSQYVPEVRQLLQEAYTVLAEHHIVVGTHYFSRGLYTAAAERFKEAIKQNATIEDPESLLYHLAFSLARASDEYGHFYGFATRAKQETESQRYRELHERYLYEAKQYLAELQERFPAASDRADRVSRAINDVTPIQNEVN